MTGLRSTIGRALAGAGIVGLLFQSCAQVRAQPALPSVQDFFGLPEVSEERISPSGQYLAILGRGPSGRTRLVTVDLTAPSKLLATYAVDNGDVVSVHWVNDKRLVFNTWDSTGVKFKYNGTLISIDRDGSDQRDVSLDTGFFKYFEYFAPVHDGSDDIIVSEWRRSGDTMSRNYQIVLHRMNTRPPGRAVEDLTIGQPDGIVQWVLDPDDVPRVAVASVNDRRIVYERERDGKKWNVLGEFDQIRSGEFEPEFIGFDGTLYAEHESAGALYRYDLARQQFGPDPVVRLAGFDANVVPYLDRKARKLLGVRYWTDAHGSSWLDPRMAEIQKKIDAALPQTVNVISCNDCLSSKFLLIDASSDRQPPLYFAYDVAADKLFGVGSARPKIKPAQMGRRDFVRYTARDGLSIPAYVTLPPAPYHRPYPLVVLVHGGPWVRGSSWEWEPESQFLASRGYAVIQPEFRGSWGFGFEYFKAGWHQWGLAMQDDLADAARWAVAQGIADPGRIAIAGASYGGYASLMGLIRNPEIFKCAVEWLGVSDLNLIYTVQWSDASDLYLRYGAPVLIGDPKTDGEQLKANSPLQNAQRITQPILMAYGSLDARVPLIHGEKLHSAIATPKGDVEWIVYTYEGHGWYMEKDNIDFWTRVEKFLDKYLKSSPASGKSAAHDH